MFRIPTGNLIGSTFKIIYMNICHGIKYDRSKKVVRLDEIFKLGSPAAESKLYSIDMK